MGNFLEGIHSNFKTMQRTGYTTNLAEMCKEKNCNLIVASNEQLKHIKKDFSDLKCVTLYEFQKLRGVQEPFYLDNTALEELLSRWYETERSQTMLQSEHDELKKRNNLLFDEFIDLRRQIIEEQEKNSLLAEKLKEIETLSKRNFLKKIWNKLKSFLRGR